MGHMPHGPRPEINHRCRTQEAHALTIALQNDRAVQVVAAQASDLDDCLELLAMLGLTARAPHRLARLD